MTARNIRGPDLLVTDQACRNAWSVQVKTNAKKHNAWRLGQEGSVISSPTYLFIFVTLNGASNPNFMVVSSEVVAAKRKGKSMPYFNRGDGPYSSDGFELFEATALHELPWEGAREVARKPKNYSTARLEKARALLKPAKDNKLDRDYRTAITVELTSRNSVQDQG